MVNAQGISLPSPLGEGLGVRPVAVEVRQVVLCLKSFLTVVTSPSFNTHIIPYEN